MAPKSPVMKKMMEPKDINKNGKIDGWEQARFDAIQKSTNESSSGVNYGSPVENKHIKAHNPALYGKRSPVPMVGSNQEKTRENERSYVDDKKVVRSAQMQRLMDNKPPASDKEAMKRWQASYDKAFNAFKKKQGKA